MTLIERDTLAAGEVRAALAATFSARGTHPLPNSLSPPPGAWARDFPGMAAEAGLTTTDYLVAFATLGAYWSANALGGSP